MLKSTVYILLSSILIFSILAPSVLNLLSETESFVLLDTTEEEKSEKTEKTEKEEKILQYSFSDIDSLLSEKVNSSVFHYLETHTNHFSKVILPPPEHII